MLLPLARGWLHGSDPSRATSNRNQVRRSGGEAGKVNSLASLTKAAAAYAATVFAIGFLLGTVRVLLLAPHLGTTLAVSVETPLILTLSWYVCGAWMRLFVVSPEIRTRIFVGAFAFVTLTVLEVTLSIALFHRSIGEYLAALRSPAGAIGFAGQVCFATFPLIHVVVRRRSSASSHVPF